MKSLSIKILLSACLFILGVFDVYTQDRIRTFSVKGLYTSSSRLFPSPEAADEIARSRYNSLDHIFGYGADVRYGIPSLSLILGFTVEYLQKTGDFFTRYEIDDETFHVPTIDGYHIIPIELTGYFLIPVSSERFQFYIGGGAGVYLGRRMYEIGGARSESLERSIYPGIHVVSGIDYYFHRRIGIRGEMKFRDPDIETRNRFTQNSIIYNGETFNLPDEEVPSRINVDGITFSLSLVFRF
jgi:hypothetical protein